MRLGSDSQNNLVFLTISEYGQEFSESLHLVSLGEEGIRILTLDEDQRCQYYYDLVGPGSWRCKRGRVTLHKRIKIINSIPIF